MRSIASGNYLAAILAERPSQVRPTAASSVTTNSRRHLIQSGLPKDCFRIANLAAMLRAGTSEALREGADMVHVVTIQPINSIVFLSGGGMVDVPADKVSRNNSLVADSPDCLIICVYPEVDGPTEVTIGRGDEVDPGFAPSFVGRVETRTGRIIIDQVDEFVVHDQAVDGASVTVTAWFSHPRWPEKVFIGID